MDIFTVAYTDESYPFTLYFRCHAEDAEHAKKQCMDAYPDCALLWANEGISSVKQ